MKKRMLRLLSLLLVLALGLGIPVPAQAKDREGAERPQALTEAAYVSADRIFEDLEELRPDADAQAAETGVQWVYRTVSTMDGVVPGTVAFEGTDRVVWMTQEGVRCVYSTYYEELAENCRPYEVQIPEDGGPETRGTHGTDVYLIEPYYGIDNSFTGQYQREAMDIAAATGGHYFFRVGARATIDAVAKALEDGGLVIFDSHGNTDYKSGADSTSGATTSYLCLSTKEGVTAQDYADGHANYSVKGGITFCEVDGVAISNHMTKDAQNSMIWAAICLGMATDGLCTPLRARGVNLMCGYSQSVSFAGDYCFEEVFFDSLITGKTVAASVADMKARYGCWDYSPEIASATGTGRGYATIEAARAARCAFPIVSSPEDPYPGHGNVDDLQEVNAAWRLIEPDCRHRSTEIRDAKEPTCFEDGYTGDTWCRICKECIARGEVLPANSDHCPSADFADVKPEKWYHRAVDYMVSQGYMKGTGAETFAPGKTMTRAELAQLFFGMEGQPETEPESSFSDVAPGKWYTPAILWAADRGIVNGVGGGKFDPAGTVTREQVVLMLCRYASGQAPEEDVLSGFGDGDKVSSWAREAMGWAVSGGFLQGSGGMLNPKGQMTRAEVAQLIMGYCISKTTD